MIQNIRNIIPDHFLSCGLDHFSPSQATCPVDVWVYKYLYCSSKDRSKFEGNSRMHCGKEVGTAVEDWYLKNEMSTGVRLYSPINDIDKENYEEDKKGFVPTLENAIKGFEEVGVKKEHKNFFENQVNLRSKQLELPVTGFTDLQNDKVVIELKTKWRTRSVSEATGKVTYRKNNPPKKPTRDHLKQAAFYHVCTKLPTFIVYATDTGTSVHDIRDFDYQEAFYEFVRSLVVKQNIAAQEHPKNFVQVDFSDFRWRIGDEYLSRAKELFYGNGI